MIQSANHALAKQMSASGHQQTTCKITKNILYILEGKNLRLFFGDNPL